MEQHLTDILEQTKDNLIVSDAFTKADSIINNPKYKVQHEHLFNITHSDCYKKYGLDRTGCVGCPFGKYFENELKAVSRYEPIYQKIFRF